MTHIVRFRKNFNAFADDVAYLLRHKMIYRSDGGHRARGIVRANKILRLIHDAYLDPTIAYKEGQELHLRIIIVRIRDTVPPNRWVVGVDFRSPLFVEDIEFEKGESVEAPTPCNRLETLFTLAEFGSTKPAFGLEKAKNVCLLIDFAERVGCPICLDLWYYNRPLLKRYTSPSTVDNDRRDMTEKTNGKLPLDGMSTISPHSEWRVYPFKRILELYNPNSNMDQSDNAARQIYYHWNEIDQSMAELYMNVVKGSQMSGQMKIFPWQDDKVAKLVFGLAGPIFKHIHEYRKKGSDHLYSCFPVTK